MKAQTLGGKPASLIAPRSMAQGTRREGNRDLKVIFGICVAAFFVVACVARVLRWDWLATGAARMSLAEEARSAAATVVGYVSMS
jgi:hypothetical protein